MSYCQHPIRMERWAQQLMRAGLQEQIPRRRRAADANGSKSEQLHAAGRVGARRRSRRCGVGAAQPPGDAEHAGLAAPPPRAAEDAGLTAPPPGAAERDSWPRRRRGPQTAMAGRDAVEGRPERAGGEEGPPSGPCPLHRRRCIGPPLSCRSRSELREEGEIGYGFILYAEISGYVVRVE